jgi:hypothetical protein
MEMYFKQRAIKGKVVGAKWMRLPCELDGGEISCGNNIKMTIALLFASG